MKTTNLTLEERAQFERLLAEYANAEMDCVRAHTRRHDASHAIQDWVNARTKSLVSAALEGMTAAPIITMQGDFVPTGTPYKLRPFHDAEVARGEKHLKQDAPVGDCSCPTCCEVRALRGILTNAPTAPILDTSGGN